MAACPTCGGPMRTRSVKHHALVHVICRVAASMWPEHHRFQPQGVTKSARGEHLRGWLEVEADYVNVVEYEASTSADVEHILGVLRGVRKMMLGSTGYIRIVHDEKSGVLRVITPDSIDYATLGRSPAKFTAITNKLFDIIELETGMKVSDMKKSEVDA